MIQSDQKRGRSLVRFDGKLFLTLSVMLASSMHAEAVPPMLDRLLRPLHRRGSEPESCPDAGIETLARNVDWLENEVQHWGSIVPKTPDIWGEARLTKYRREVEQQLAAEISGFDRDRISGSQTVTDTAFLAAALSLDSQPNLPPGQNAVAAPSASINVANFDRATPVTDIQIGPQTDPRPIFGSQGNVQVNGTFGIEQVAQLDQLHRYLSHLGELRRINEGDDDADAPGYSINMVRIPISVLPGTRSRQGYGAEVTLTASPVMDPSLLPNAFKDLVINDLVDQIAVPMTMFLNQNGDRVPEIVDGAFRFESALPLLNDRVERICQRLLPHTGPLAEFSAERSLRFELYDIQTGRFSESIDLLNFRPFLKDLTILVAFTQAAQAMRTDAGQNRTDRSVSKAINLELSTANQQSLRLSIQNENPLFQASELLAPEAISDAENLLAQLSELTAQSEDLRGFSTLARSIYLPNASTRKSTLPYPPRHLAENIGFQTMAAVVRSTQYAFSQDLLNRQIVHLTDVQGLLREELTAAYEMLSRPELAYLWTDSSDELLAAIRLRQRQSIAAIRTQFIDRAGYRADKTTPALAWAVYVESVLLSERLGQSIDEHLQRPNCEVSLRPRYFGPSPSAEARDLFTQYVASRWPLKIFTIDPVTTEQNIADSSSVYRQMQLAISLAFSGGEIGARAATSMMRAIQRDIATIDLNRTAVGFAHGENTFGWRFYPRFQTPPVEGNLTVAFRDLIAGGPTDAALLRQQQLEPGMRECIAIIITPSFVSDMVVQSSSRWFRLDKPGRTVPSNRETVRYSRSISAMRHTADACVRRPDQYRDGELPRLLTRVQQLDHQLPLQTLRCRLPTENTLGGFELLASGRRELAPELLGWYGAPGYDVGRGGAFFLAGDNFSVHETRVIGGNTSLRDSAVTLVSRQILQIDLPPGLPVISDERIDQIWPHQYAGFVDVHVASPYGVSGHLLIPTVKPGVTRLPPPGPNGGDDGSLVSGAPTLMDTPVQIDVHVEFNKNSWNVESILPRQLSTATIALIQDSGQTMSNATVYLTPESPQGSLPTIKFEGLSVDGQNQLRVGGSDVISKWNSNGSLRKSFVPYIEWWLSVNRPGGALTVSLPPDDHSETLTIRMSAEVEFGSTKIPAIGHTHVMIRLHETK